VYRDVYNHSYRPENIPVNSNSCLITKFRVPMRGIKTVPGSRDLKTIQVAQIAKSIDNNEETNQNSLKTEHTAML
jgi:hypothetical protein